ncbi:MAG: hypothetical protein ABN479_03695 [Billgrantia sp.]|uniref:Uncharacterized protein n=1 Tax=Thioalkalivibrio sulfidiphilus (strain HL-EbGR7) TaxID=396588 RepID=B8GS15_THISH|nr:hypothetical protein [Thioalkalivibrio sulfidiphilus]ACL72719.1 hypothetical protein Tgr7_1636 [Thioalkalivibrio sulfidiphilus HL-EbGr7]
MTTKTRATKGAAKAPEADAKDTQPGQGATETDVKEPATDAAAKDGATAKPEEGKPDPSAPAKAASAGGETPAKGQVTVVVSTRLERRIRGGVVVTRRATEQVVSETVLAQLERDPLIEVKRS